jgi:hypothetical protein
LHPRNRNLPVPQIVLAKVRFNVIASGRPNGQVTSWHVEKLASPLVEGLGESGAEVRAAKQGVPDPGNSAHAREFQPI